MDRELVERTTRAIPRPTGIAHLEDAEVLDVVDLARRTGLGDFQPRLAVMALTGQLPRS